jgi:hypothetical protein
MRTAFDLVAPGGSLGVFVPAMSRLYGSLDYKSGTTVVRQGAPR